MLQEILRYLDDSGVGSETIDEVWGIAFKWKGKCLESRKGRWGGSYWEGKQDTMDELLGDMTGGVDY